MSIRNYRRKGKQLFLCEEVVDLALSAMAATMSAVATRHDDVLRAGFQGDALFQTHIADADVERSCNIPA